MGMGFALTTPLLLLVLPLPATEDPWGGEILTSSNCSSFRRPPFSVKSCFPCWRSWEMWANEPWFWEELTDGPAVVEFAFSSVGLGVWLEDWGWSPETPQTQKAIRAAHCSSSDYGGKFSSGESPAWFCDSCACVSQNIYMEFIWNCSLPQIIPRGIWYKPVACWQLKVEQLVIG